MNLFCEEVHKLEAEFKQCRKLLNAIGGWEPPAPYMRHDEYAD